MEWGEQASDLRLLIQCSHSCVAGLNTGIIPRRQTGRGGREQIETMVGERSGGNPWMERERGRITFGTNTGQLEARHSSLCNVTCSSHNAHDIALLAQHTMSTVYLQHSSAGHPEGGGH